MTLKDNFRVCLHTCHKPEDTKSRRHPSMKKIEIFLMESGSSKQHNKHHQCPEDEPCQGPPVLYRKMEDDDWVKFASVLWSSRKGDRRSFVLQRYQQAWRTIYQADPPLNSDGGPVNFLHNPQYTCRKPVPWLSAALDDSDGLAPEQLHEPGPSSTSAAHLPASPGPQPGPSASAPSQGFLQPDRSPSAIRMPNLSPPFSPLEPSTDSIDAELDSLFRQSSVELECVSPFARIKDSFFPGFAEYLSNTTKPRLRVIFPLIPQYRIIKKDQMSTPYISCMELSPDDVEFITRVDSQCLYRADEQGNTAADQVRCFCSSWLDLAFEMKEHTDLWDLRLMRWEDFSDAVLERVGPNWDLICGAHLLIGGPDFADSFLEDARALYGVPYSQMEDLWEGMGILSRRLTIWPDPLHLLAEGSKLYHMRIIHESSASLQHSCPRVVKVDPTPELADEITNGTTSGVLKREFSSEGRHVYTPHTQHAKAKLREALKAQSTAYNSKITKFPKPRWYLQPYIAPLLILGEIRAFIVNGVFYAAVITSPAQANNLGYLDVQEALLFTPLSELRMPQEDRGSTGRIPRLASSTVSVHQVEFEGSVPHYALTLLSRLVIADEFYRKQRSSFRIFVRMDISVYQHNGRFRYMVNELTSSQYTGLFLDWPKAQMDFCLQDLTKTLHYVAQQDLAERNRILTKGKEMENE